MGIEPATRPALTTDPPGTTKRSLQCLTFWEAFVNNGFDLSVHGSGTIQWYLLHADKRKVFRLASRKQRVKAWSPPHVIWIDPVVELASEVAKQDAAERRRSKRKAGKGKGKSGSSRGDGRGRPGRGRGRGRKAGKGFELERVLLDDASGASDSAASGRVADGGSISAFKRTNNKTSIVAGCCIPYDLREHLVINCHEPLLGGPFIINWSERLPKSTSVVRQQRSFSSGSSIRRSTVR